MATVMDTRLHSRPAHSFIRYRYVLVALGFLGLASVYSMRVNLTVAMVAMVKPRTEHKNVTGTCPVVESSGMEMNVTREKKVGTFEWDLYTQGIVLGAFYYGYIVTPIPGGMLAERYGAKWFFGCGTLITAILGFFIPLVSEHAGASGLIALRILQGLSEGVTYPAIEAHVAHWLPVNERTTGIAVIHTGGFTGVVVGLLFSGYLADSSYGWPSVFYSASLFSAIWFVFWALLTANRPEDHPWISQSELKYILTSLEDQKPTHATTTPWRQILTSPAVLAVVAAMFGANWLQYMLITELPTYLGTVLHFDIEDNGLYSSLPYLGAVIAGAVAGPSADYLRRNNHLSATNIRKLYNGTALFVPSIMLMIVVWVAGCDGGISLLLFVIAGTLRGLCEGGYMSIPVDMAPDYAGTVIGICICFGNTTGFLVPFITGLLINKENSTRTWSYNFYLTGVICIACAIVFQLFASAEVQPWGLEKKNQSDDRRKVEEENKKNKL